MKGYMKESLNIENNKPVLCCDVSAVYPDYLTPIAK